MGCQFGTFHPPPERRIRISLFVHSWLIFLIWCTVHRSTPSLSLLDGPGADRYALRQMCMARFHVSRTSFETLFKPRRFALLQLRFNSAENLVNNFPSVPDVGVSRFRALRPKS